MEIIPSKTCESLKRAWRRRKYQKLHGAMSSSNKRELKITGLGSSATATATHKESKLKTNPKLNLEMVSPTQLLTKFHNAYVNMTMRFVNNMGDANNKGGVFRGKKIARDAHIVSMASEGEQLIDTRLVLEVYKRFAASRDLRFSAFEL